MFPYCLWLLLCHGSRAESLQHSLHGPKSLKYLLSGPLQENLPSLNLQRGPGLMEMQRQQLTTVWVWRGNRLQLKNEGRAKGQEEHPIPKSSPLPQAPHCSYLALLTPLSDHQFMITSPSSQQSLSKILFTPSTGLLPITTLQAEMNRSALCKMITQLFLKCFLGDPGKISSLEPTKVHCSGTFTIGMEIQGSDGHTICQF